MSDVDTLRRAAALMREQAQNALSAIGDGAWWFAGIGWTDPHGTTYTVEERTWGGHVCEAGTEELAEHIASWHPAVALAVADWLDYMARILEQTCDCNWPAQPFAVARAYLGGE